MSFVAKFWGTCVACDGKIVPGDSEIESTGEGYVHVDCDASADLRPAREICPVHFVELPASGRCDSCE